MVEQLRVKTIANVNDYYTPFYKEDVILLDMSTILRYRPSEYEYDGILLQDVFNYQFDKFDLTAKSNFDYDVYVKTLKDILNIPNSYLKWSTNLSNLSPGIEYVYFAYRELITKIILDSLAYYNIHVTRLYNKSNIIYRMENNTLLEKSGYIDKVLIRFPNSIELVVKVVKDVKI